MAGDSQPRIARTDRSDPTQSAGLRTVFVDVDTQLDFLYPAGALYVPHAERIVPAVARLNRYAVEHGIPLISTTDAHAEDDIEFSQWPPHCIAGTWGQHKPEVTRVGTGQIIVEKQTVDVFKAPALAGVLERLNADRYVVYGVVTEICVRSAALGLLKTGKPVAVVTDAIAELTAEACRATLEEITSAGGHLVTEATILGNG